MCKSISANIPRDFQAAASHFILIMSFFERFAYKRNTETLMGFGSSGKEKKRKNERNSIEMGRYTPIKAHQSKELLSIPETPDFLLPTPPEQRTSEIRCKKHYQRKRPRILSSSDDEVSTQSSHIPASTSNNIFSSLPFSKRDCKKDGADLVSKLSITKDKVGNSTTSEFQNNAGQGKPRRLFRRKDDSMEREELSSWHNNGYATRKYRVAESKKKQQRRRILELISDSDDSDDNIETNKLLQRKEDRQATGWLSTRSIPVRAKLEQFAFRKTGKEKQEKQRSSKVDCFSSSSDGFSCIEISSELDSSPSDVCSVTRTQDSSSQFSEKSSQDTSPSLHTTDSSCSNISSQFISPLLTDDIECCVNSPGTEPPESKSSSILRIHGKPRPVTRPVTWQSHEKELDKHEELEMSDSSSESDDYTITQKRLILEFLNGCSQEEMCNIPGCSLTKAKQLTDLRPFNNWTQLVRK